MNEIMTIQGIECYEVEGTAWLKLETLARGLGFTQTQNKNGTEYTSIRWETVFRYLEEIGFPNKLGKDDGFPQKWGKDDFIPENVFYRLAMKARNETAEKFQALIADEIIPAIRKHGAYIAPGAQPQGVEAAALQAVVQPITAALEALTGVVQAMDQRLDGLEQGRNEMRALPPGDGGESSTPGIASQRRWMRTVSEKLDLLSNKYNRPHNLILSKIYKDMEEEFDTVMEDERYRTIEEQGLEKCSVLTAIFFDEELRDYFQRYVDHNLAPENRGW